MHAPFERMTSVEKACRPARATRDHTAFVRARDAEATRTIDANSQAVRRLLLRARRRKRPAAKFEAKVDIAFAHGDRVTHFAGTELIETRPKHQRLDVVCSAGDTHGDGYARRRRIRSKSNDHTVLKDESSRKDPRTQTFRWCCNDTELFLNR